MADVETITSDEYLGMLEEIIFNGSNPDDREDCIDALFEFTKILDEHQAMETNDYE